MPATADDGRVSRRGLLAVGAVAALGGAGLLGVDQGLLPGRDRLFHALGHDGADGVVPSARPGPVTSGSFVSAARLGTRVGWSIALPPGHHRRPLPVAVVLHGRGNDHASAFSGSYLALDRYLAAAVGSGVRPFALASVDGGETYWHDRADGDRAATMVLDEFVPLLARHGLDTRRIGLLGWSMGGFGALYLAGRLGAERVAGVAVMSPALWREYADAAPGAFDGERDFDAVEVMGRQDALTGIPVRVDCGEGDPFCAATRDYVDGFSVRPAGGFELGDHDLGYWRRMAPAELTFLGHSFAG